MFRCCMFRAGMFLCRNVRLHISGRRTEFLKIFLDLPEFYQFVLHGICQNAARIYQNGLCPYIRAAQIQQGIPYKTFRFCSE